MRKAKKNELRGSTNRKKALAKEKKRKEMRKQPSLETRVKYLERMQEVILQTIAHIYVKNEREKTTQKRINVQYSYINPS